MLYICYFIGFYHVPSILYHNIKYVNIGFGKCYSIWYKNTEFCGVIPAWPWRCKLLLIIPSHVPNWISRYPLQWCHNGSDGVSNRKPHECVLNRLFRRKSKKTSKLRVIGLNERLSKHSCGRWLETPSRPLCRHSNDYVTIRSFHFRLMPASDLSTGIAGPWVRPVFINHSRWCYTCKTFCHWLRPFSHGLR